MEARKVVPYVVPHRRDPREELLSFFRTPGVFRQSTHPLSSGRIANNYFDFDLLVRDPFQCEKIVQGMADKIRSIGVSRKIDCLGFLDKQENTVGAISIAGALAINLGIPFVIIRLRKDITFEKVKGGGLEGLSVLIVTDHISYGKEILAAADALDMKGASVLGVVSYTLNTERFDEEDNKNTKRQFSDRGLEVEYVVTFAEALEHSDLVKASR